MDGDEIECAGKCYAIEVYQSGWMPVCTFPLTEDGYTQAESVMKHISYLYARISTYA